MPKTDDAMDAGRAARRAGQSPATNPHPWKDRDECLAWIWGYGEAGTDLAREAHAEGRPSN